MFIGKNKMKQTVTKNMFMDSFSEQYKNNFTYEGKGALYDYLTELEENLGYELELDPIGVCCEYAEYASLEEFNEDYRKDYKNMDDISQDTTYIPIDNERFIIQQF